MRQESKGGTYRQDVGKFHRYYIDGVRVPGCTTAIGNGAPKNLSKWGAETTAAKAVNEWDRLAGLPVAQRLKELEKAPFDVIDRAGIKGTRVHKLAEKILAGETVTVPEEVAGYVQACRDFLRDYGVKPVLVEEPVFSRAHQYGATLDLLAELKDGRIALIDWKTNKSGAWGDTAWQLAASRYAEFRVGPEGKELPVPQVDLCGVVWLTAEDGYVFYPYEVTPDVFEEYLAIMRVADAVENSKSYRGDPLTPPVTIGAE